MEASAPSLLPPFVRWESSSFDEDEGLCRTVFFVAVDDVDEDDVAPLTVALDASRRAAADDHAAYPFERPRAFVVSGASRVVDLRDGDEVRVDCDWTPSLHLWDAAAHVALVLRECARRRTPYSLTEHRSTGG